MMGFGQPFRKAFCKAFGHQSSLRTPSPGQTPSTGQSILSENTPPHRPTAAGIAAQPSVPETVPEISRPGSKQDQESTIPPQEEALDMTKKLTKLNIGKKPKDTTSSVLPVLENLRMPTALCPPCAMCSLPAVMVCSDCRFSRYCSAECRAKDWPAHQLLCRAFRDVLVPPLSKAAEQISFRRAILFPAKAQRPLFIWLKCEFKPGRYWDDRAGDLLGEHHPMDDRVSVQRNLVREKDLEHTLDVVFCDDFYSESINQSISAATQREVKFQWCGNAGAVSREGQDQEMIGDITMEDFRNVLDFFLIFDGRDRRSFMRALQGQSRKIIATASSPFKTTTLLV